MLQISSCSVEKIQKVGLSQESCDNKSESEIGMWLKSIFGIEFLGPDEVEDAFVEDFMLMAPNDNMSTNFADYLTLRDIELQFTPILWDFHLI